MNTAERDRISRLLDSVEREENIVDHRPTGAFVRELFANSDEEDINLDDIGAEELHYEEHGDIRDHEEENEQDVLPEYVTDFDDLEAIPLSRRLTENILPRINGKLAYISKSRDMLWDVEPDLQRRTPNRNILRMRMGRVTRSAADANTPIEVWNKFITEAIIQEIVDNTNIWIEINKNKYARERDTKPTNAHEIRAVIGLLYMAGVMKNSHTILEDLWATDGTGIEFFPSVMSIKRFKFMLRSIRFDNVLTRRDREELDNLAAIRDLFEQFVNNCQENFVVSEFVTIDEMLESFRGRCKFRVYMKSKPARYGLKVYALVCAKTFYTYNLEVYVGKQPEGPFYVTNSSKEVVLRLIEPLSGSGRNVTVDNFFTSIPLCFELLNDHRMTLVGTVRANKREIPSVLLDVKQRPVGSSIFAHKKECTMVSYKAKKNKHVLLLSSMHNDATVDQNEYSPTFRKPEIILFYNCSKGGVDTVDKYKESYSTARITRRWPMRLFYSILDIGALNAFVILKQNLSQPNMKRRTFIKDLAKNLCKDYVQSRVTQVGHLSKDRKKRICQIMDLQIEQQPNRGPPSDDVTKGRCHICDYRKNRPSTTKCVKCHFFMCREHSAPASCVQCNVSEDEDVMDVSSDDTLPDV